MRITSDVIVRERAGLGGQHGHERPGATDGDVIAPLQDVNAHQIHAIGRGELQIGDLDAQIEVDGGIGLEEGLCGCEQVLEGAGVSGAEWVVGLRRQRLFQPARPMMGAWFLQKRALNR